MGSVLVSEALDRSRRLRDDAICWDMHSCPTYEASGDILPDLHRYIGAGVHAVHINIGDSNMGLAEHILLISRFREFLKHHDDRFILGSTVADVRRAKAEGKLAVFFDIEGAHVIGEHLPLIDLFFDLGVRWMALVYNARNQVGGGCHDIVDEGLTDFGWRLLERMDAVGMIKDCSHTGYRTAMQVMEASPTPVIFSHSNPRRLRDHPRNIPDELIEACARTNGVVGINGVGIFLGNPDTRSETVVKHIDYVANLVGPAHVGLGLDFVFDVTELDRKLAEDQHIWPANFGYAPGIPFVAPEQWPEIVDGLARLRYSDDEILGILGGNFMRVADTVWGAGSPRTTHGVT